jgi:hypothetical protein
VDKTTRTARQPGNRANKQHKIEPTPQAMSPSVPRNAAIRSRTERTIKQTPEHQTLQTPPRLPKEGFRKGSFVTKREAGLTFTPATVSTKPSAENTARFSVVPSQTVPSRMLTLAQAGSAATPTSAPPNSKLQLNLASSAVFGSMSVKSLSTAGVLNSAGVASQNQGNTQGYTPYSYNPAGVASQNQGNTQGYTPYSYNPAGVASQNQGSGSVPDPHTQGYTPYSYNPAGVGSQNQGSDPVLSYEANAGNRPVTDSRTPKVMSGTAPSNSANGVHEKGNGENAAARQFQQNRRIQASDQWVDSDYDVFRDYRSEWHDRDWWRTHQSRIVFGAGGWYYWTTGYWFPAWGYDPMVYYAYDGPIYAYSDLPPDQVVSKVQGTLREHGYYQGESDGLLAPPTSAALVGYQRDHGLYETSTIDRPTSQSLGIK